jgi:methylmalonyl-CoA mutase
VENSRVRSEQLAKLVRLRADRDDAAVQAALADVTRAASVGAGASTGGDPLENNLLALAIAAARVKATVGEISDALEKVYGRHQAEIRTISGVYRDEVDRGQASAGGSITGLTEATRLVAKFAEADGRRPRILVAKMGQDGHDRGARVIASAFADLGFDVDVGPLFQTPDEVAKQAIENDVHVCGISTLAGAHRTLVPELVQILKREGKGDILVVAGGVIPEQDWDALRKAGVADIYGPGTVIPDAANRLLDLLSAGGR